MCMFSIYTYTLFFYLCAIHPTPKGVGFSHVFVSMLTLGNTISDISLSIDFGTIVGFTRGELKKYFYDHLVMAVTLLQNKSEEKVTNSDIETLLDQLASWYDGYSFDENAQSHVFSTISVLNFFCNSNARTKFKNYLRIPNLIQLFSIKTAYSLS